MLATTSGDLTARVWDRRTKREAICINVPLFVSVLPSSGLLLMLLVVKGQFSFDSIAFIRDTPFILTGEKGKTAAERKVGRPSRVSARQIDFQDA